VTKKVFGSLGFLGVAADFATAAGKGGEIGGVATTGAGTEFEGTETGSTDGGDGGGACSATVGVGCTLCSPAEVEVCVEGGADVQPTIPIKHPNVETTIDVLRNVTILSPPFLTVCPV
jgi:hypothetical protein